MRNKQAVTLSDRTLRTCRSICVEALQKKLGNLTIDLEKLPLRSMSIDTKIVPATDKSRIHFNAEKRSRNTSRSDAPSYMYVRLCRGTALEMSRFNN